MRTLPPARNIDGPPTVDRVSSGVVRASMIVLATTIVLAATVVSGSTVAATTRGDLAPQMAEDRPDDDMVIRKHIDSIFQAYIGKDRKTVRATHSVDWRGFLRPSRSVIKGIDSYMQAAEAALSGPFGLSDYEFVEYDVIFYGDTAVVNYVAELTPGRDIPFRPQIRVLDVYVLQDDHWTQVASQTASHPDTLAAGRQQPSPITPALRQEILDARERVWRSWFENRPDLAMLVPAETIAINAAEEDWQNQEAILAAAGSFSARGNKLLSLKFPHTKMQLYGDVAILYTLYVMELEVAGESTTLSGRGTEIFVRRDGGWVNSGWHLDSGR